MNNDVLPIGATKKYELKALQGKLFCLRQRNIRWNKYINFTSQKCVRDA
jgi:hypothetical protein